MRIWTNVADPEVSYTQNIIKPDASQKLQQYMRGPLRRHGIIVGATAALRNARKAFVCVSTASTSDMLTRAASYVDP
jgi:hypothetical protein